ncbi:hypothetical protein [Rhodoblastus acidophilus]|uniref:hypothetical protein n=1 Tax=Rhodoblastus acidophilus TaxID=1074 RepID=UPI0022240140|nr:hypothetical protein [Rhodoblastus acidophilus]
MFDHGGDIKRVPDQWMHFARFCKMGRGLTPKFKHESHLADDGLGDRRCINDFVLVRFDVGLNELRRDIAPNFYPALSSL